MNREFLELYNRELKLLQEQAREFAEEYPGIAERLGGLVEDRSDPMIAGLLEGCAFLAARVQLKLKHEFPEFTNNLLEQLAPNYLAPTPSAMLAQVRVPFGDAALREGRTIARGSYLDATYRERERRVACRYRLSSDVTLWPFDISGAEYYASPGPLHALGLAAAPEVAAGLRLSLTHRTTPRLEDEIGDQEASDDPTMHFRGCAIKSLPIYLLGAEADAVAIYEQIFADCIGIHVRYLDPFGDPVVLTAPQDCLEPVGFGREETLLPNDLRVFEGFDLLREYFMFSRKFLGFRLTRLAELVSRIPAKSIDILFTFDEVNGRLAAAVQPSAFALYTAPAVNLFEMTMDRVPVQARQHEYHLVPDRSRYLDFEPHRVLAVFAHHVGRPEKVPVEPLYSAQGDGAQTGLFYTLRRLPRRRSTREQAYGVTSDYTGTDVFLSLIEPTGIDDDLGVGEISVRALCSNRHLPEQLPIGEGGADFRLSEDATLDITCVAGPTLPREPIVAHMRSRTETAFTGAVTWRLINMLSLNQLGIVQRGAGSGGRALRETLTLFADLSDPTSERRIRGIRNIDSRPVVRRLRQRSGTGTARGTEVTVTLDEKAFEGSGAFLLGAILDRFFAEYASINHFTQTVIRTVERGQIMRWPPRIGSRRIL
ncbi:MAG: type secretion protein [Enterovirga sp.]|nr:type secretion protein [Enterovirga sp.]